MTGVDVPTVAKAVTDSETEVVILVSIGDYVAFGDAIAEVRMARDQDASALGRVIAQSLVIEDQRDLDTDPAFGIEQLVTIGWTSISTAKSNPDPGLLTIWNLRDLLARWLQTDGAFGSAVDAAADPNSPVVYIDNLPNQVMGGSNPLQSWRLNRCSINVPPRSTEHLPCSIIGYRRFLANRRKSLSCARFRASAIIF